MFSYLYTRRLTPGPRRTLWLPGVALLAASLFLAGCGDNSSNAEADDISGSSVPGWSDLSRGGQHVLAVAANGTLWGWGENSFGQLGQGITAPSFSYVPVQIGTDHGWRRVAAGLLFSVAIKADGSLWAWGENGRGQLGKGDFTTRYVPTRVGSSNNWWKVAAGAEFVVALKANGERWGWGANDMGQAGVGDTLDKDVPTRGVDVHTYRDIYATSNNALALAKDGSGWSWGDNTYGQNGQFVGGGMGISAGSVNGGGMYFSHLATGGDHVVGLVTDGTVVAWGYNAFGQLAIGDTTNRTGPTTIDQFGTYGTLGGKLGASNTATFLIAPDRSLWSAGANGAGQLGIGGFTDQPLLTPVGGSADWATVTVGPLMDSIIAFRKDVSRWVWGSNVDGEFGDGTLSGSDIPLPMNP